MGAVFTAARITKVNGTIATSNYRVDKKEVIHSVTGCIIGKKLEVYKIIV